MKKTCGRITGALAALLLAVQMALPQGALGASYAAAAGNDGIMTIATETLVSSSELSEFNTYWELGGTVVIHETVASSGGVTSETPSLPLYINASSSYYTPVSNPIIGAYGVKNKQTGLYWLAYRYGQNDGIDHLCKSNGSDNHLSMDYYQAFKNGDYVTMSYAKLGENLYKDEKGRIYFKVYNFMSYGGFAVSLYRAYFMKSGLEMVYIDSLSILDNLDQSSFVYAKNPSVDAVADAIIKSWTGREYYTTYTGSVQIHPAYTAALSGGGIKLSLGSPLATDVGRYTFYLEPQTGYTWSDGTTTPRFLALNISKADPTGALPELTVSPQSQTPYGLTGDGALTPTSGVTYTSSDTDVGTFEGGVFVAGRKLGKTTVTAEFPGNQNLNAGTWTGTVTVALTGGIYLEDGSGGMTVYPTLQEAYDALPDGGGTIHVLGNAAVDSGLTTVSGKDVTVVGESGDVAPTLNRTGDFSTFTVTDGAELTLKNITVTAQSGAADNGGAIYVRGGSLVLEDGVVLTGNKAAGKGGAVYVSAGAESVTLGSITLNNNSAGFGNGIYIEDGATVTVAGSVANLGDGIAIGYDATKTGTEDRGTVDVTTALDGNLTVEFENPAEQVSGTDGILYVVSSSGAVDPADLKANLLVRNPGYTFDTTSEGLSLKTANTIVAAIKGAGDRWTEYTDPQKALDEVADGGTVYFAVYENDADTSLNTTEVLLYETLKIPAGKHITFSGVKKHVPNDPEPTPDYTENVTVTLKRADGNTEALVYVPAGAELTLGNITLDGGAVWSGGISISDDGYGGAGTVETGNTGVTAHAPVIVNAGTLNIGAGATIQNNDNNYAAPGAGFGSQNYGGGVRNEAGGTLIMTGGAIRDCYAREGGGIMNVCKPDENGAYAGENPSVTVSGGVITGCMSQQKGAAIQTIYGGANTLVTSGASITGCASLHDLGVLSVEEGGTLTVSGGTVTAAADKNALYLYNKYSAEDYESAVTKPFIEGAGVGRLTVTGSPNITGKVHIDDSCLVVDKGTRYEAFADLTDCAVKVTLDFTGGEKSFGKVAQWGSVKPTYTAPTSDGATNVFYLEVAEGGVNVLRRSGYALTFTQAAPNELDITGTCDPAITGFTVEAGGSTVELTLDNGSVTGKIVFDGAGTGTTFESTLKPVFNGTAQAFAGPALQVLRFNSADKTITAPDGTTYLTETGSYEAFSGTSLPGNAALDGGNASFKVGDSIITVHVGDPQDPPVLDGEVVTLADVTDTSLDLDVSAGFQNLEFRLSYESGGSTAYTLWQTPSGGRLAFTGLDAGTQYTVLTRTPGNADAMPSAAVACPGGVFVTLTAAQNTEKAKFEAAYTSWKANTTADPADALTQYDALASTLTDATPKDQLALDEVTTLERDRLAELEAARDRQAADKWLADHLATMEDSVANTAPAGTKDRAGAALDAYNALSEEAQALVDDALARHQSGGASAPLPDPLTAYRNLTAAEIRDKAAAAPGLEDFVETYANAVQGAADKDAVDTAMESFNNAIGPATRAQTAYNDFVAAGGLGPRTQTLAQQALERTYAAIADAAGDVDTMNSAVDALRGALDHARDAGEAFQDYLESREALTGQSIPVDAQTGLPTDTDAAAQEALDMAMALEAAADPSAMNALLQEKVRSLLEEAGENGSSAVQKLVEEGKAAVDEAVTNANGSLADLSAVVRDIVNKINAQKAAEQAAEQAAQQAAANAAALNDYKAAAQEKIEELAAQYDDAGMYAGAREELAALKESLLEDVQNVTLADGLAAARQELDSLSESAEAAFAQKAAQGFAQQEYLDGAENLTGETPDPAASPAKEVLEAIREARDTAGMNDALRDALGTIAQGLADRAEDSDAVLSLVDAVLADMDGAVKTAGEGEIAPLAALTETLRADLAAQRQSEIAEAQEEYRDAYNALTGENVTDLADPRLQPAADAIGRAQNCAQANEALARAVDQALEALKRPGDTAQVTKAIEDIRESVAARAAASGGKIAAFSDLLGDVSARLEALRDPTQTPTDPEPTEPEPTDPEPTEPEPSDPGHTDPNPPDDPNPPKPPDGPGGDSAERTAFEELKAQLLDEADKLLREHDGEHVRDVLGQGADLLEGLEFEEAAPDESLDALRETFDEVKRETEQAQRLQRFENSARAQIDRARASGRCDGEALDGLYDTYVALAAKLPAEGREGDPQGDMDALYGEFMAELNALRGPAVNLWWLAAGLAALFAVCVIVQLLFRRKSGKHDKTGR